MTAPADELAACVLVVCGQVGSLLSEQEPRIGRIDQQARSAFAARAPMWSTLVTPVARALMALAPTGALPTDSPELVGEYVGELGGGIDVDAAAALDAAMDSQIAQGQHPGVAWQRVVAAYGLDLPAMRGYLSTVSKPDTPGAASALLSTSKAMAQRALLARAAKIGDREAAAWASLPAGTTAALAKAYDPQELRDEGGRWATRRGPEVKEKEKQAPDALDDLLRQDRFAGADRFAGGDRFARDRFAGGDRFADRFAGDDSSSALDRFGADRFAGKPKRHHRRIVHLPGLRAPGSAPPPPPPPARSNSDYSLYLPMGTVDGYFGRNDHGTQNGIDFGHIRLFYAHEGAPKPPFEARAARSPWAAAQGADDIDPDDWSTVLAVAVPLWHAVQDDPEEAANQLGVDELSEVFERAGYQSAWSSRELKARIADNVAMRDSGVDTMQRPDGTVTHYDSGLLDALADFVVWNSPETMGEQGSGVAQALDDHLDRFQLDETPIPAVMTFGHGMNEHEDAADLRGRYIIHSITYHSGIGEYGGGAPVGKIGLRETFIKPE